MQTLFCDGGDSLQGQERAGAAYVHDGVLKNSRSFARFHDYLPIKLLKTSPNDKKKL